MSIKKLFNHRAVVYRDANKDTPETARDELGDPVQHWEALSAPSGNNCRPDQTWSGTLRDYGPGEQQGTPQMWFLDKGFDVAERDVLKVESGDWAPLNLKILSVTPCANRRSLHHFEVRGEVWHGALTAVATS